MSFKAFLVLVAALLLAGGGITFHLAGLEPGPLVTIHQPAAIGGGQITLDFAVDSVGTRLTRIDATLEQQGRVFPVFSLSAPGNTRFTQETRERIRITRVLPAGSFTGLRDGTARLVVTSARQVLRGLRKAETVVTRDLKVRITPPTVAVLSTQHYIKLGGAEMVVYRVSPPGASSGVQVGTRYFPGFPAAGVDPARKDIDPSLRVAFFGLLFDEDLKAPVRLVVRDDAGNEATANLEHRTLTASFKRRSIPVDDAFLRRVVPAVLQGTPELKLPADTPEERLDAFLTINGELRQQNEQKIVEVSRETSPEMLWRGTFLRMSAKSEAVFADHRKYVHGGRVIDEQVHLGADLASLRGAPIKAANAGHVLFAGFLGIYGNCVILDHGMGVQTLYGHLSVAEVEAGDRVDRGEVIGRTGATGLAGGDHLHFAVLLGGRPVNPLEWWDPHWIADRVARKLVEAGLADMTWAQAPSRAAAPPAAKKRTAGRDAKPAPKKQAAPPPPRRKR